MTYKNWTTPLAAIVCVLGSASSLSAAPAVAMTLANYPGDAPGTMPIEIVAKSTTCQMHGYLRYSEEARHCVND